MPSSQARAAPWPGSKLRRRRNAVAKTSAARSSANGVPTRRAMKRCTTAKLTSKHCSKSASPMTGLLSAAPARRWLGPLTLNDCQFASQVFPDGRNVQSGPPPRRATGQPESEGPARRWPLVTTPDKIHKQDVIPDLGKPTRPSTR